MIQKALPLLNKLVVYVVGLFVLAFGISLSIRANLGVTPMSSIPRALELLAAGKLSLGVVTMIVYALISRKLAPEKNHMGVKAALFLKSLHILFHLLYLQKIQTYHFF